jgi:hypothetical protein
MLAAGCPRAAPGRLYTSPTHLPDQQGKAGVADDVECCSALCGEALHRWHLRGNKKSGKGGEEPGRGRWMIAQSAA